MYFQGEQVRLDGEATEVRLVPLVLLVHQPNVENVKLDVQVDK